MFRFLESDKTWVKYATIVAGLIFGGIAWEIFGLNSNPAFMAPLIGNVDHPGAAPRLIANFSDEEFESLSSIAKNKEMTTERYLSSLKFASLPENKMEASFGDVLGKFVDLLDE